MEIEIKYIKQERGDMVVEIISDHKQVTRLSREDFQIDEIFSIDGAKLGTITKRFSELGDLIKSTFIAEKGVNVIYL